jgi:hypothetical protein
MLNYEEARVRQPGIGSAPKAIPGIRAAVLIAGLSALGLGYWVHAGQPARGEPTGADISRVAEVAPQDIPAALETIEGTPQDLARFKAQDACKARLAWVTILHAPGQPTGRIRLQSGHYFSPAFTLTDMPVRVALPFPAPYPIGRGTITVLGTTTDAIVALTPPWHVPAQGTVHAQDVTWTPVSACPNAKT